MGIGLYSRMQRGPCRESHGSIWHCSQLLPANIWLQLLPTASEAQG
jgi:hypothetical protein